MSHWGIEAVTEVSRELTTSVSIKFRLVLPLDAWELLLPQAANVQADMPSNATVAIFDVTGRLIQNVALNSFSGTNELNVSAYPAGVYLVLVKQGEAVVFSSKLVVE